MKRKQHQGELEEGRIAFYKMGRGRKAPKEEYEGLSTEQKEKDSYTHSYNARKENISRKRIHRPCQKVAIQRIL